MKISNKKNKTFLDQKYKYVELDPVDKQFNNKNYNAHNQLLS